MGTFFGIPVPSGTWFGVNLMWEPVDGMTGPVEVSSPLPISELRPDAFGAGEQLPTYPQPVLLPQLEQV